MQKAVVVVTDNPQSVGQLREKLSVVTSAWFAQRYVVLGLKVDECSGLRVGNYSSECYKSGSDCVWRKKADVCGL